MPTSSTTLKPPAVRYANPWLHFALTLMQVGMATASRKPSPAEKAFCRSNRESCRMGNSCCTNLICATEYSLVPGLNTCFPHHAVRQTNLVPLSGLILITVMLAPSSASTC